MEGKCSANGKRDFWETDKRHHQILGTSAFNEPYKKEQINQHIHYCSWGKGASVPRLVSLTCQEGRSNPANTQRGQQTIKAQKNNPSKLQRGEHVQNGNDVIHSSKHVKHSSGQAELPGQGPTAETELCRPGAVTHSTLSHQIQSQCSKFSSALTLPFHHV